MENNQTLIKINEQYYKIQIVKTNDILNIIVTNTITKTSFACGLNDNAIKEITQKADFIRNMDQICNYLIIGAKNEESNKFKLVGKINYDDSTLILTLIVNIGLIENETIFYVIEMSKVPKDNIIRMEEMMLDFCDNYGKPNNENIKNID